ncbi:MULTISPECIES: adenylate/guanylate cyclase domain-containing protein [Mycobacterium]|uniref:Adenylate cyclase n=1 Tax=Mycobacterium kiyosense TaxID=2871094 RepID=A0A9P3QBE8_9MYCO|nr:MULTISPECIES: adenylate/guanylate cyclase domain-containing protein [Mycobacterium]BDB42876.1 adenylate cyclase [Mycobacterium kiyosense]BDE13890.1 adenylate cyclase [Mycobacterium sp. 20KCMC460]GLB83779.1 adenylate cyclase [Mycobacterium kiyosense]GLB91338.1 adenylate cyclase [Mycobacterium kiyosense]GLB97213.1 adenylate cyclase [Mycobacterium kiyosense]
MGAKKCAALKAGNDDPVRRPDCVAAVRAQTKDLRQHYADAAARRARILDIAAWMAVLVSGSFVAVQLLTGSWLWQVISINIAAALVFAFVPMLHRFGELVAPLTFIFAAYATVLASCWDVGTGSGAQLFFIVGSCLAVLLLGIEHIVLASFLAALGAGLVIMSEFVIPRSTGLQPDWAQSTGFVVTTISACVMVVATVYFALRDTARAEAVMEEQYERSEALLANMLPASIAERLKEPERRVIADKYDEASVLFADIVGFTERASSTPPADLVRFLDRLYSAFDALVDKYELEKIKVSGDSYMVVSGVPRPRPDHVHALADFALDMADAAAALKDPHGRAVPLRVGLATGPVVAGVVGSRRFFYDVWGDAVNVASRMESTDSVGQIQVPDEVYERLKDDFELRERGYIDVKGKGVMRTWYLMGRKPVEEPDSLPAEDLRVAPV